jgi:hypothetical protein
MCVLFYSSFVCISAYANVYFKTTIIKQNIKIILIAGVPSSQALPGYLITAPPSVCVPDVIGVLAVWIQNQKKKSMTLGKWSKDGWREETKQACPSLPGPACWHELAELDKRMPHERPRQLAHPSSSSFHTSPAPNTNSTFHTK